MLSTSPFFIVGCGRSGTSLLRGFLNSHNKIAIPTESLFVIDYLRVADRFDLPYLLKLLVQEPEIQEWGLVLHPNALSGASTITEALRILHDLYAQSRGKQFWGQKTPRYVRHLELIGDAFPDAVIIHLVRDPRAVVNSLIRSDVHRSTVYHAATRWQMDVRAGLAYEADYPNKVLRVRYEELVAHPQNTLEEITRFIGLDFDKGMLTARTGTEEYSAFYENIHSNLNEEISSNHVEKWKTQLKPTEIRVVESMLGDMMAPLGYNSMIEPVDLGSFYTLTQRLYRLPCLGLQVLKYLSQRPEYLRFMIYRKWKLGLLREFLWKIHY